jgi:formylglycine-generating enzyme required for sulfatase activity
VPAPAPAAPALSPGALRVSASSTLADDPWLVGRKGAVSLDGGAAAEVALPHEVEDVAAGAHTVTLAVSGYAVEGEAPAEPLSVPVPPGGTVEAAFRLTPEPGALRVVAPGAPAAGVRVRLDGGAWQAVAALPQEFAEIAPGEHTVELEAEGCTVEPGKCTVTVSPGATVEVGFAVKAEPVPVPAVSGEPPGAGSPVTVADLGMELVWVAPGSFHMGSNDGAPDEKPVHAVRISRGFWLGKYEVTQGEYEGLMGNNPSSFKGARNPVECVPWNDAVAFCGKLTEREHAAGRLPAGYVYRLPTEAEWEYACRAGSTTRFCFGEDESLLCQYGNYCDRSNTSNLPWKDKGHSDGFDKTAPVGSLKPNAWGLYDMHGNVWEWCLDWYDSGYYGRSPATDPLNAQAASSRVFRGGSWCNSAWGVRSAYRFGFRPVLTCLSLGFRACLAPRSEGQ